MGKSEMDTINEDESRWDRAGRIFYGEFQVNSSFRAHRFELYTESTIKGQYPPQYRVVVKGVAGRFQDRECTVQYTKEGLRISDAKMYSAIGKEGQDIVKTMADTGYDAMTRGWNSGLKAGLKEGYARGFEEGVAQERENARDERARTGKATRAIHDQIQQEARESGRSFEEVSGEHGRRIVQQRRDAKAQSGEQGI